MPLTQPYQFYAYGATHQGNVREHNEDHFLDLSAEGLWVVADGAGGHDRGEVASELIVQQLTSLKTQNFLGDLLKTVDANLQAVNHQLIQMRSQAGSAGIIGSTVCVLLVHENHSVCLWAGDSRIYLLRQGVLKQLTHDHNRMDEFKQAGFPEEELAHYSAARQLIHAVGVEEPLFLEMHMQECCAEDVFLLCSDGLYGELDEPTLLNHLLSLQTSSPQKVVDSLIHQVLMGRARDNVTALLVQLKANT